MAARPGAARPGVTGAVGPETSPVAPADARRVVLADLLGRVAGLLVALARLYESAGETAEAPLREALAALARSQSRAMAEAAPLLASLGVAAAPPPTATPTPGRWGLVLGQAFQWERALEDLGRQLAVLAGETPAGALGGRVATTAAQDGAEVRRLYLRYS